MSNSMPSDTTPAIVRGGRLTTKSACLPCSDFGSARSRLRPATMVRSWSPKRTRSATSLLEPATSSTAAIVPTRTSIESRTAAAIVALIGAGVIYFFVHLPVKTPGDQVLPSVDASPLTVRDVGLTMVVVHLLQARLPSN